MTFDYFNSWPFVPVCQAFMECAESPALPQAFMLKLHGGRAGCGWTPPPSLTQWPWDPGCFPGCPLTPLFPSLTLSRPFSLCSAFPLTPNLSVTVKSSPLARWWNRSLGCGGRCGDGRAAIGPGRRGFAWARMQGATEGGECSGTWAQLGDWLKGGQGAERAPPG